MVSRRQRPTARRSHTPTVLRLQRALAALAKPHKEWAVAVSTTSGRQKSLTYGPTRGTQHSAGQGLQGCGRGASQDLKDICFRLKRLERENDDRGFLLPNLLRNSSLATHVQAQQHTTWIEVQISVCLRVRTLPHPNIQSKMECKRRSKGIGAYFLDPPISNRGASKTSLLATTHVLERKPFQNHKCVRHALFQGFVSLFFPRGALWS